MRTAIRLINRSISLTFAVLIFTSCSNPSDDDSLSYEFKIEEEMVISYPYSAKATLGGANVIVTFNSEDNLRIHTEKDNGKILDCEYRRGDELFMLSNGQWISAAVFVYAEIKKEQWGRVEFIRYGDFLKAKSDPANWKVLSADRVRVKIFLKLSDPVPKVEIIEADRL